MSYQLSFKTEEYLGSPWQSSGFDSFSLAEGLGSFLVRGPGIPLAPHALPEKRKVEYTTNQNTSKISNSNPTGTSFSDLLTVEKHPVQPLGLDKLLHKRAVK